MKCPNCGAENPEINRFCGDCGATIEALPAQLEPPAVQQSRPDATVPRTPLRLSEKTKKRLVVGGIVIAAILIIGAVAGYLYYYQPVRGSGSASATTIDVGQEVQFGYTPSKGVSPYKYAWNFGDGGLSSEQNPHHTYTSTGTHVSTVAVWDTAGKEATWATTILVNPLPSVVGTASPLIGDQSLNASFTAQGRDGTPGYGYLWQFGDGTSSSVQNPIHNYTAGDYTAVVVIEDSVGVTASWSASISVNAYPRPSVVGTVTPAVGFLSLNASFTAQGVGGTPSYSYLWQFGDGTTSDIQNPMHYYTTGNYVAVVFVEDSAGMTATWSVNVTVNLNLTTGITYYYTGPRLTESFGCTPDQGVPPYSFYWQFGDGMSSTLQNPVHEYARTGLYTFILQLTDSIGEMVEIQRTLNFT